jgi:hypothetical protein
MGLHAVLVQNPRRVSARDREKGALNERFLRLKSSLSMLWMCLVPEEIDEALFV